MSTFRVLTIGVCLVWGLQAAETPANRGAADWAATLHAGKLAMHQQNFSQAARFFGESVTLSRTKVERITALASYGIALSRDARNTEAKTVLEQALGEWGDSSAEGRAIASGVLGSVDRSLGDYRGAERVLRAAMGEPMASPRDRAGLMVNLADLLREEARVTEAKTLLDEASGLNVFTPQERINVLMETAELDLDLRLCDESMELWKQISAIAGTEDTGIDAAVDGGLGESWLEEGNLARAEPLLRKSLQLLRSDPNTSPLQIAKTLAAVARLYLDEDKLALADEVLTEAIQKDEASLGRAHPQIAALLELRATILSRHGEPQDARDDLDRALTIMSNHFGPDSIAVAVVYTSLGDVEEHANRPEAAVEQYGNALRIFREAGAERTGPGASVMARYTAALKAAHLSAKTSSGQAGMPTIPGGAQSFRGK